MADPQDVARIRAYLQQYGATFSQEALRTRLITDGHPIDAIDLAFAQEYAPQASETPTIPPTGVEAITPSEPTETHRPIETPSPAPDATPATSTLLAPPPVLEVPAATPSAPPVGYVIAGAPPAAPKSSCAKVALVAFGVLLLNFVAVPLLIGLLSEFINLGSSDDFVIGSLVLVVIVAIGEGVGAYMTRRSDVGISRGLMIGLGLTILAFLLLVALIVFITGLF